MNKDSGYTYRDAGFNRFFRRSIGSNPDAVNLKSVMRGASQQLNFDNAQISGSLGDVLKVGRITIDGKQGRQSIFDERSNEILRLGDLGDD